MLDNPRKGRKQPCASDIIFGLTLTLLIVVLLVSALAPFFTAA